MKSVLITGADGFIGSHLAENLVKKGYKVKAFVMYNSFNSWGWLDSINNEVKNEIEVFMGDIRDPFCVKNAIKGNEVVLHLAALIGIPYSYKSPQSYISTNINGTLNILEACKDTSVQKLIHTSTSEVYGTAIKVPIDENHPLQAQSPYSASKISADQIAFSYYNSFELPVGIIRPFNTYGPRQSLRAVIPSIITQINSGMENIKLGALSPTRDFNFIDDTVSGFESAINNDSVIGQAINIGSNFEISIGDTANLLINLMNREISILSDPIRIRPSNSEVERLFSDNSKAKKLLNWKPQYSGINGFKKGLSKTIKWFSDFENVKNYKNNIYNI